MRRIVRTIAVHRGRASSDMDRPFERKKVRGRAVRNSTARERACVPHATPPVAWRTLRSFLHFPKGMRRLPSHENTLGIAVPLFRRSSREAERGGFSTIELCLQKVYDYQKEGADSRYTGRRTVESIRAKGLTGVTAQEKSAPVKSGKEVGIILATNAPPICESIPLGYSSRAKREGDRRKSGGGVFENHCLPLSLFDPNGN